MLGCESFGVECLPTRGNKRADGGNERAGVDAFFTIYSCDVGALEEISLKADQIVASSKEAAQEQRNISSHLIQVGKGLQAVANRIYSAQEWAEMKEGQTTVDIDTRTVVESGKRVSCGMSFDGPIDVEVMLTVERLQDVDTVQQEFKAQVLVQFRWRCPTWESPVPAEDDDGDWRPSLEPKFRFRNVIEVLWEHDPFYTTVKKDGQAYIYGEQRQFLKLGESLELKAFPTDCQELTVCINSVLPTSRFKWTPFFVEAKKRLYMGDLVKEHVHINDFSLVKECTHTSKMYVAIRGDREVFHLEVSVKTVRKSFFYMVNVALITCLLVSMVFCGWGAGDPSDRYNIDFSLMLTCVAFKLTLASLLPAISYTTRMDHYLMISFAFLCIIAGVHALYPFTIFSHADLSTLTWAPTSLPAEDEYNDRDMEMCYILGGCWSSFNLIYLIRCHILGSSEYNKFARDAIADQIEFNKAAGIDSPVSK